MKLSILAPGKMAEKMARVALSMKDIELYAVASRDRDRAFSFANRWGFKKAYGSYEEMLLDPMVEMVYVTSPHSHHFEHAMKCLNHGKPVLLEKAFTVNAEQAELLIQTAEEKNLLLVEAAWPRFLPGRELLRNLLESGVIGRVRSLTANEGSNLAGTERLENPQTAGGALLDLGVYAAYFALDLFPEDVVAASAIPVMSTRGIDWSDNISVAFKDGKTAFLHTTMIAHTNRQACISGEKGYIEVQNINTYNEIRVFDGETRNMVTSYQMPLDQDKYEYELKAFMKALQEGKTECKEMPHKETLRVMRLMDRLRSSYGMKYPCE